MNSNNKFDLTEWDDRTIIIKHASSKLDEFLCIVCNQTFAEDQPRITQIEENIDTKKTTLKMIHENTCLPLYQQRKTDALIERIQLLNRNIPLNHNQSIEILKVQNHSMFIQWIQPFLDWPINFFYIPINFFSDFNSPFHSYIIKYETSSSISTTITKFVPFLGLTFDMLKMMLSKLCFYQCTLKTKSDNINIMTFTKTLNQSLKEFALKFHEVDSYVWTFYAQSGITLNSAIIYIVILTQASNEPCNFIMEKLYERKEYLKIKDISKSFNLIEQQQAIKYVTEINKKIFDFICSINIKEYSLIPLRINNETIIYPFNINTTKTRNLAIQYINAYEEPIIFDSIPLWPLIVPHKENILTLVLLENGNALRSEPMPLFLDRENEYKYLIQSCGFNKKEMNLFTQNLSLKN